MKAMLIKVNDYYNLQDEKGNVIGTSYQFKSPVGDNLHKLSKQNCDSLFGVVDAVKLAEEEIPNDGFADTTLMQKGFIKGFKKAMELNKDKLFTLKDLETVWDRSVDYRHNPIHENSFGECIKSIQQPIEINVEIEMDFIPADRALNGWDTFPKLDTEGCLILKKI